MKLFRILKAALIFSLFYIVASMGISYAATQEVRLSPSAGSVNSGTSFQVSVLYDVSDANKELSGVGFKIYYDSTKLLFSTTSNIFSFGKTAADSVPKDDTANGDGDAATDKYLGFAWLDLNASWPGTGQTLPLELLKLGFQAKPEATGSTAIRIVFTSSAAGYTRTPTNATVNFVVTPGNVSGIVSGLFKGGRILIGAYSDAQLTNLIQGTELLSLGAYTVSNLQPGNYYLAAFNSVDGTGVRKAADPAGTYIGNPVAVTSGATAANKDIILSFPELGITKAADKGSVNLGDTITYTLTYRNTGSADALNAVIKEKIPDNTTYVSSSPAGTYNEGTREVTWAVAKVDKTTGSGAVSVTVQVAATGLADQTAIVNNTYSIASDEIKTPVQGAVISSIPVNAPVLVVRKTGPAQIPAGDDLTYRIYYRNSGHMSASQVVIRDTIPTGLPEGTLTFKGATGGGTESDGVVSWMVPVLTVSQDESFVEFTVTVKDGTANGTLIRNITYSIQSAQTAQVAGQDAVQTTVVSQPILNIAKAGAPGEVLPGGELTYTITYSNTGNQNAAGVVISDTLPANVSYVEGSASDGGSYNATDRKVTWNIGALASKSGDKTVSFKVKANLDLADGAEIVNGAYNITATGGYTQAGQAVTTKVIKPILSIAKQADKVSVDLLQTLTYTITYGNTGGADATAAEIRDTVPAGTTFVSATGGGTESGGVVTWNIGTVAKKTGTGTVSFTVRVDGADLAHGSKVINNAYSIQSAEAATPATGLPIETTVVVKRQEISLSPSANNVTSGSRITVGVNYQVTDGNNKLVGVGFRIHFDSSKMTYTGYTGLFATGSMGVQIQTDTGNYDNNTATDQYVLVAWSDINANWPNTDFPLKLVDLAFTLKEGLAEGSTALAVTPKSLATGYDFRGTGSVLSIMKTGSISGAVTSSAYQAGVIVVGAYADATFNTLVSSAMIGAPGNYLIENLPPGTYFLRAFNDVNGTGVKDPSEAAGFIGTPVTVAIAETTTGQNIELVKPVLSVSKVANVTTVSPGGEVIYTLTYRNTGGAAATGVVITDALPANTALKNGTVTGGGTFSSGILTWNIGTVIANSGELSVSFTVLVNDAGILAEGDKITNATFGIVANETAPVTGAAVQTTVTIPKYSISGTFRYSGPQTGQLVVSLYRTTDVAFANAVSFQTYPWAAGSTNREFSLSAPDGLYVIRAFIDVNANGSWDPGEHLFTYRGAVSIAGANDTQARNIDVHTIRGTVNYPWYQAGKLYVGCFDDVNYTNVVSIYTEQWATGAGAIDYALYVTGGNYYLGAYIDTDNDGQIDAAEPQGRYGSQIVLTDGDINGLQINLTDTLKYQFVRGATKNISARAGGDFSFDVLYSTSDNNNNLTGLGLRIHYDDTKLNFKEFKEVMPGYAGLDTVPKSDTANYDKDEATNKYLQIAWADINGNWPNVTLPVKLYRVTFTAIASLPNNSETTIKFSGSTAVGYAFAGEPVNFKVRLFNLDIDGSGEAMPLSDGLLAMRHLFGFVGESLINRAVEDNATRKTADDIAGYMTEGLTMMDVDGDGEALPLSDGLLIMRYLFGFEGDALINRAVSETATRKSATDIKQYLDQMLP